MFSDLRDLTTADWMMLVEEAYGEGFVNGNNYIPGVPDERIIFYWLKSEARAKAREMTKHERPDNT